MKILTIDNYPEGEIKESLGIVRGSTVRAKHIGKDILSGFKQIIGGEMTAYTEMIEEARDEAMKRMIVEAEKLGADAIVGFKLTSSQVMQGASEIVAYGTAVKIKK